MSGHWSKPLAHWFEPNFPMRMEHQGHGDLIAQGSHLHWVSLISEKTSPLLSPASQTPVPAWLDQPGLPD